MRVGKVSSLLLCVYVFYLLKGAETVFEIIECIGCRSDRQIIESYFKCHMMLPTRIKHNGEACIKNVTQTSDLREQWMKICSSKDLFYLVYICTDVSKGAPGGAKEQKEKQQVLQYILKGTNSAGDYGKFKESQMFIKVTKQFVYK
ncbi:hypothetical protein HNY73_019523 [Argiope bruennichi]|uniref:Uncharacterized protein n=1 Tax=Argiope bruennichi TaxID=94029 RepID=A0A8T0E4M5_ARGBR|nr:hypothetical protein HNY73_019523 [Argiope bruennichi]